MSGRVACRHAAEPRVGMFPLVIPPPLGDGTDGVYDRVEYTYNRLGERVTKKDQNETVHQYAYDGLGRPTEDRVRPREKGTFYFFRAAPRINSASSSKK